MGSRDGPAEEQPVHRVIITSSFWLGTTPVTQRQFACFESGHKSCFHGKNHRPAQRVNWHQAKRFCQWLTEKRLTGSDWQRWQADLPTEGEWEYACRAGTDSSYCSGDGEQSLAHAGWFRANSDDSTEKVGQSRPTDARRKRSNAFGLYDMHGNVCEWCLDEWRKDVYRLRADGASDPIALGPEEPLKSPVSRTIRGGAHNLPSFFCRSAYRIGNGAADLGRFQGFRVALLPGPRCEATKAL